MEFTESYKLECKIRKMLKPQVQPPFPGKLYVELHPMGEGAAHRGATLLTGGAPVPSRAPL